MSLYLCHHGIKGQKWGVRRFENEDGTLTEAGKKRYYDSNGRLTRKGAKSEHWKKKRNKMYDRMIDLENEYDKKNKETHSALVKAAKKAYNDDSDKTWGDYYKKFNAHEGKKAVYVGKKLVQEFGEADVDNLINNYNIFYIRDKVDGKTVVDRYVKRFEADYDIYF